MSTATTGISRDTVERRLLAVLRPAFIVFLLIICLFPFYYMVLLSFRPLDAVLQDPGALWPNLGEIDLDTYKNVLASTEDGGQGFLNFIKNSMLVAVGTVVVSLLVAVPGAYAVSRLEFFGRRQISAVFLGIYFFPAILLAIPLFVLFTRLGQRGTLTGLLVVYVAQVAAVSIYMLRNYFDTIPASLEEAAAIDGCTRLQAMRHVEPAAGRAGDRVERPVRLHDRLERVPLRLAVPRGAAGQLDGLPRPLAARGEHRGADHGSDGGLGDPHPPDHRALLPQRALAGRRTHRRRGEGLTPTVTDPQPRRTSVPEVVSFAAPYDVALVPCEPQSAGAGIGAAAHLVLRHLRRHRADRVPGLEPLPDPHVGRRAPTVRRRRADLRLPGAGLGVLRGR